MNNTVIGWLFDLYPTPKGMTLWLLDEWGNYYKGVAAFSPSFYLHVNKNEKGIVESISKHLNCEVSNDWIEKLELYSNKLIKVLEIKVKNPLHLKSVVHEFELRFPYYAFFNSDLTYAQSFLFSRNLFPLAYGKYIFDDSMNLLNFELFDDIDSTEYSVPQFNIMTLFPCNKEISPKYCHNYTYEIGYDGLKYITETSSSKEFIEELNNHIKRCDPDIILTQYGDYPVLPQLESLSKKVGVPLQLNRDEEYKFQGSKEISYWSYGKVVHRSGSFELAGRWHIDMRNSFIVGESDLSGLIELARISRIPVQKQARTSIGTGLSSIQLAWAYQHNILIPAKKQEWEKFKTASQLLLSDRGGLIFLPLMGYHEEVAELDFASMYPSLMSNHNISPETVNCECCLNYKVPELNYTICEKRRGIIPKTLDGVLHKRAVYKEKRNCAKTETEKHEFDKRQNALKWLLVTSFGYLGYKNARFGKIEAHESVNAFSRDALLEAKEIAEDMGFKIIHAIVDCIWVKKKGAVEKDYEELAECITKKIQVNISLEGIYKWILFPTSKMNSRIPAANRYAGAYKNGKLKVRGLDMRRG
ncbi:MAG: DNA polymerase domain-containing protein, partial [Ignavibacteriaceae bacterium]